MAEVLVNSAVAPTGTADTTLNNGGPLTSGATSLVVASLPAYVSSAAFRIRIDDELLVVTAIGGTGNKTWTVTRGAEGTTAASHADGANVYLVPTAGGLGQWLTDLLSSSTPAAAAFSAAAGSSASPSHGDHAHAVFLTTASAQLSGNVSIPTAGTYVDGPSVSLAAGTWLVVASCLVQCGSTTSFHVEGKLWDGTTAYNSAEYSLPNSGNVAQITLAAIVSPGSTTTYKFSATVGHATGTIWASTPDNGSGNNASSIVAVRIG